MDEIYRGWILEPRVSELLDHSGWTATTYISETTGGKRMNYESPLNGTYATREEAVLAAIEYGRHQIDGIVGVKIDDTG